MRLLRAALDNVLCAPIDGDGGGGGGVGTKGAAAAPAEGWPRAEEWDVLKEQLTPDQLANVKKLLDRSDSLFLAKVSAILDPLRNNENDTIHQLVATHSATLIYIILVRTSPDEWEIVLINCKSQKSRCLAAYQYLEDNAEKGTVLLYPVSVAGKGISRWDDDETGGKAAVIDKVKSIIQTTKSKAPEKDICLLVMEPNRIDGDTEKAFATVDEIEGLGVLGGSVEVEFIKFFRGDRKILKAAALVHEKERREISEVATHVDAAKSLRQGLGDDDKAKQQQINEASVPIQEQLSRDGSEARKWLVDGVARGQELLEEYTKFGDKETTLGRYLQHSLQGLREMPDGDNEVPEMARKTGNRYLRNARKLNGNKIGSPDLIVTYLRGSPAATDREDIPIEGKEVPAQQAALAYASYKDLGLLGDGTKHVILPVIAPRQAFYVEAHACLAGLYVEGRIEMLGIKAPPRLSQYRGYVDFFETLNAKTGAKDILMTACRGLKPGPIALNEQKRALGLTASADKYREALTSSDEVGKALSEIAWSRQFAEDELLEKWGFEEEEEEEEDSV